MITEITRLPEALAAARALCKCVFCVNWRRVELVCKGLAEKVR